VLDRTTGDFLRGVLAGASGLGATLETDVARTPSSLTALTTGP
jgi:hypothetical protein